MGYILLCGRYKPVHVLAMCTLPIPTTKTSVRAFADTKLAIRISIESSESIYDY